MHARLEEGVGHVNRGKELALCAVCQDLTDVRDGEGVCDCVLVELSVIVHPMRKYGGVGFWDDEGG